TADLLNAIQALSQLSYTPIADEPTPSSQRGVFRPELVNSSYFNRGSSDCQHFFSLFLFSFFGSRTKRRKGDFQVRRRALRHS
ncbi:MAG: hypothetical protein LIO42_01970, partial [Oscillospiraceae bacterium]|nr:hypothetical protein [Oscillospiraceae bacterium]